MKIGAFMELLAEVLDVDLGSVRVVARALREAGWLPTGPRGVNAPDVTETDAAYLVIALLAGSPPSRVVKDFEKYGSLQLKADDDPPVWMDELEPVTNGLDLSVARDCLAAFLRGLADYRNYEFFVDEASQRPISLGITVSNRPLALVISAGEGMRDAARFFHPDHATRNWTGGIRSMNRIKEQEILRIAEAISESPSKLLQQSSLDEAKE